MDAQRPAILAQDLVKRFGDFTAVNGVSFEVQPGQIFGFLGPNGAGKTTTIRMILGLLKPTAGRAEVLGLPVAQAAAQIRPRVGYMSQRFSLYNDLTVRQNLTFFGRAYGLSDAELAERMRQALDMAGLAGREHVRTKDLSGGWRQRLALSAAVLHRPQVLFLDEPTAGVDPVSRRAFWDMLYSLAAEGVTVLVTTHYMDEAEHCQRLAFIQRGRLTACGSPEEIKRSLMPGPVLELAPADAGAALQALRRAQQAGRLPPAEIELYGSRLHVVAPEAHRLRRPIARALKAAGLDPGPMDLIEPSLEDVFIASMR